MDLLRCIPAIAGTGRAQAACLPPLAASSVRIERIPLMKPALSRLKRASIMDFADRDVQNAADARSAAATSCLFPALQALPVSYL
ncbi:MAG TPA: hypothetical protein VGE51_15695 [Fontimonas sp.]